MHDSLKAIGEKFNLPGTFYACETITNGNVNSTYKVTYLDKGEPVSYIFQRINTYAFHKPEEIMMNIDRVSNHIHEHFPDEQTLVFYNTDEGHNYCYDSSGDFWRVMNYVDSITFNATDDAAVIESVGQAFGHFTMQLSGFDGNLLYETIPNFHNTAARLDKLFADAAEDPKRRRSKVQAELDYISSVKDLASDLSIRFNNKDLPVRVTHNDTKCNNVLFDRVTKKPLVVIDYDTIMPGMAIYDFGDAVRFIANTADEDEPDISKVSFDIDKYRAFCKGYIREVRDSITQEELDSMGLATFSITIELASRFLDDYLLGDEYFKINYPEHNLVRTRCQLALAKDIWSKMVQLNAIVKEVASE